MARILRGWFSWGIPDLPLLGIVLTLLFVGVLVLSSVSASFSLQKTGNSFFYLNHQLLFGFLPGILAAVFLLSLRLEVLKRWSFPLLLVTAALLLLVFVPGIGKDVGGAHRWIFLGPFSFQPSELLKITFILYAAFWLSARTKGTLQKQFLGVLLPFGIVSGAIALLLFLQPDMSTLGVIGAVALTMYFVSGTPLWHIPIFLGTGAAAFLGLLILSPYRLSRLSVFLDPSLDPLGKGYQIKQALIGIGSGGLWGTGLSFQKFGFLPEPMSDSVFAVFAEEMGFVGAVFLITLFLLFAWRGLWVARHVKDPFAKIAAAGITSWIIVQAFLHMGALTGILPLTGIPLPFISYGGSALVAELLGVGILLTISKQAV
ncbi:putative lipid II flippase FtsW [Patescibacteria group bacterium]|nr:putative lipid II flippase FtsW [Patescibacteria group bacterium]